MGFYLNKVYSRCVNKLQVWIAEYQLPREAHSLVDIHHGIPSKIGNQDGSSVERTTQPYHLCHQWITKCRDSDFSRTPCSSDNSNHLVSLQHLSPLHHIYSTAS